MNTAVATVALDLDEVRFSYSKSREILHVKQLRIDRGERIFLFGPSGSGKTTLLGLIAGVLTPQSGSVMVLGKDTAKLTNAQRDAFRGSHIGYIFQLFNLISYLSVEENIV